jgi:hypothetical protein
MTFEKWFKDELHFYCPSESDGRITALLLPEFKSVAFMAWNAALKTVEGQKPSTNTGGLKLPLDVADEIEEYCEVHQLPFDDCHFEWARQLRAGA